MPVAVLPALLPWVYTPASAAASTPDVDTGGFDILIGGLGFRLATDKEFPYTRTTENVTNQRVDQAAEVGEQTLAPLPWVKSQSSFHGGAGQRYLEPTLELAQNGPIEKIRFDNCRNVDVWTPGKVTPLGRMNEVAMPAGWGLYTNVHQGRQVVATDNFTGDAVFLVYSIADPNIQAIGWFDAGATTISVFALPAPFEQAYSITSDGTFYYATVSSPSTGETGVVQGFAGGAPSVLYLGTLAQNHGSFGSIAWVKSRLLLGAPNGETVHGIFELDPGAAPGSPFPTTPIYHGQSGTFWGSFAESPNGILVSYSETWPSESTATEVSATAANVGTASGKIIELTLDASASPPTLGGGRQVATLPTGEFINSMTSMLGTGLAISTTKGLRLASFDTYTGNLKIGPLSVENFNGTGQTIVVDRFVYCGGQLPLAVPNGGPNADWCENYRALVRVDISMPIDGAGRHAWAPDMLTVPYATAPYGTGVVVMPLHVFAVGHVTSARRLATITIDGQFFVQDLTGAAAPDGSWIRTSRIRYGTSEPKLFKMGRVRGAMNSTQVQVFGITPFLGTFNLGTFGPLDDSDDTGEFRLPVGTHEWIQLQISLIGADSELNSYQVKALPAPSRQRSYTFTVWCMNDEADKDGYFIPAGDPYARLRALNELEDTGAEVRYVEFNNGAVAEVALVQIEQSQFISVARPKPDGNFGGKITIRVRTTEGGPL